MIKGNSRILIVEGVDAFEMLMTVILEQLVANLWEKLLLLQGSNFEPLYFLKLCPIFDELIARRNFLNFSP